MLASVSDVGWRPVWSQWFNMPKNGSVKKLGQSKTHLGHWTRTRQNYDLNQKLIKNTNYSKCTLHLAQCMLVEALGNFHKFTENWWMGEWMYSRKTAQIYSRRDSWTVNHEDARELRKEGARQECNKQNIRKTIFQKKLEKISHRRKYVFARQNLNPMCLESQSH